MSKILKRPMFRKGGSAMEGVMSLAAPRKQYNSGSDPYEDKFMELVAKLREQGFTQQQAIEEARERLSEKKAYGGRIGYANGTPFEDLLKDDPYLREVYDIAQAGYGRDIQQERSDVLANLLIRGGLGLVSGEGAGKGTLGAVATAFKKPTEIALEEMKGLRQDPARMLTAKTAIAQKGAERLQMLKNQEDILDAQKKAKLVAGPQKVGESDQEYNERIRSIASDLIMSSSRSNEAVQQRFEQGQKMDRIEVIQKQEDLSYPEAASVYEFQENADKVKEATGLDIGARGGVIIGFVKNGKLDYSAAAKSLPDGIYIDPTNRTFVKIQSGKPSLIENPLIEKEQVSMMEEEITPGGEEITTFEEKQTVSKPKLVGSIRPRGGGRGRRGIPRKQPTSVFEEETQLASRPDSQRFR